MSVTHAVNEHQVCQQYVLIPWSAIAFLFKRDTWATDVHKCVVHRHTYSPCNELFSLTGGGEGKFFLKSSLIVSLKRCYINKIPFNLKCKVGPGLACLSRIP